jgi:hypothetical protein
VVGGFGSSAGFPASTGTSALGGSAGRGVSLARVGVVRTALGGVRTGSSGSGTGGGSSGLLTSTTRGGGSGICSGCATATVLACAPKHADVSAAATTTAEKMQACTARRRAVPAILRSGITRVSS